MDEAKLGPGGPVSGPKMLTVEPRTTLEGKPVVALAWGAEEGQLTPEQARGFGVAMIRAADEADSDALYFAMATQRGKVTPADAAAMLTVLRAMRAGVG